MLLVPWTARRADRAPLALRGTVITTWRWIDTITRQLELCKVTANETAVVLGTDTERHELRQLFALSLERLGCQVSEIIVRSGAVLDNNDPIDSEPVALALTACDLVVDTTGTLVPTSIARSEILEQARVLAIDVSHTADLDHLIAHPGLHKRLARADDLIQQGKFLTVSSDSGTQLEVSLTDASHTLHSGIVQKPGDLAHWPAGAIGVQPAAGTVNGCVVAMPGDIFDPAGHLIRSPVRLEIEDSLLTDVLGDTTDSDIVRSHLEGSNTTDIFDLTEIGLGMNLTRHGADLGLFDPARLAVGRRALEAGRVNISTGATETAVGPKVTWSLAGANLAIDNVDLVRNGMLEGALAADIYERAAAG